MTLAVELDLNEVKVNHCVKYLCQRSFHFICNTSSRQTHIPDVMLHLDL